MSISVLTRAYGNDRSGSNTEENVLTAAAVRNRGIRRLFSLPLPGDARGAEAQPLIVGGVALPGGRTRDLVPSMPMPVRPHGSARSERRSTGRGTSTSTSSTTIGGFFRPRSSIAQSA